MKTTIPFADCERRFFASLLQSGWQVDSVVDVGGSNAAWSSAMADILPDARFDIFEPLARREAEYARVLDWAKQTHRSFHIHEVALGAQSGEQDFWKQPWIVGSSLLARNAPASEVVRVPVATLDEFRKRHAIPQPQLIKIDVQGGELLVLDGGRATVEAADAMHIETWLGRGYGSQTPLLPEVMDFLRPLGHVLVQLGEYWRKPDQELFVVDAFFVHRRLIDSIAARGDAFPWPQNWKPGD
jgi:FkbM family methyltransferase